MTTPQRAVTVLLISSAAVTFTASCGHSHVPTKFDLGVGDATVCRAAATHNARIVYNTRAKAASHDLKTQVAKIYPGSSNSADNAAIKTVNRICAEHHFAPPASGT